MTLTRANCETDCYLVVGKVRERLLDSKQAVPMLYVERLSLKKLN
jgi:hypothetical protein